MIELPRRKRAKIFKFTTFWRIIKPKARQNMKILTILAQLQPFHCY